MIDQTSQFFAILTNVGAAKQANADALGVPWKLTDMGVGDANGTDPVPSAAQTSLINEWRRRPLNQLFIDPVNPAVIVAEQVIPADEGGFWIREIGLYDADGDLVAVANCPPSFKPIMSQGSGRTQVVRMNFIVSSTGNITLKIDPSVVLATREYVERRILEEIYKLDNKQSVRAATTANIALTGLQTVDGISLLAGDRVLVKNQAAPKDNGIYIVGVAAWQRAPDADSSAEVTSAMILSVEQGATLADTRWQLVTDGAIVLGTTSLAFQNITQGFATINSPAFLGSPTAPTAPLSNNSQLLANTAFVQRALGNHSGIGGLDVSTVLTADAFGKCFIINSANPVNITLPKASTGFNGGTITLVNVSTGTATIILQGTDYVAGIAANQLVLKTLDTITLSTGAGITWYAENGSIPDALSSAFNGGVRSILDVFGLGADAAKIPLIVDFSADIKPGLYRAFTLEHPNAAIGGPPDAGTQGGTSMTVLVSGGYISAGYKTFLAILNNTANGPTRVYIGHKTAAGTQPYWSELGQTTHLPYRAKVFYKSAGVYQWTVPANVSKVYVEVRGGGGSGAFGGDGSSTTGPGGGGGGGISNRLCTVVPGSIITVTVGAGGAFVSTEGEAGLPGGTSSFGSFCSATGGRGGVMNGGALGGVGSGGDFNASLGMGFPPVRSSGGNTNWGGPGGGGESAFAALDTSILTQPGMGGGGRLKTRSQPGVDGQVLITY